MNNPKYSDPVIPLDEQSPTLLQKISQLILCKISIISYLAPLVDVLIRVKMAYIFFVAGTLKLEDGFLGIGKGSWESTLQLFEYEYAVPYLSVEFAATSATFFEILCPVLLVLGLGARAAAFILLIMTAVIEFTYESFPEHQYWALLLLLILSRGAGVISLDYVIRKKVTK